MDADYVGLTRTTASPCHSVLSWQPVDGDQMLDRAKFGIAGQQDGLHLLRKGDREMASA